MEPSSDNNPNPQLTEPTSASEPSSIPESPSTTEPAVAPEPSPTPEPATTPEPISATEPSINTTQPSPTPESSSEPVAPKSQKSLVAIIIALALIILAGGGCLAWFMISNNSPKGGQSSNNPEPTKPDQPSAQTSYDLGKLSDFDLTFLRLEGAQDNVVYSPLSIKYALAMLSDATAGESKTQITNLIGDYQPTKYANNEHRSFANAMFIRDRIQDSILSSYTNTLEQKYNASVVYDSFANATPINNWISNNTMGIIQNLVSDDSLEDTDFALINALAIDMNWNNQLQCAGNPNGTKVPCQFYDANPAHEKYHEMIGYVSDGFYDKISFNGSEVITAKIGATANRYDIVKDLGEDYIRSTVLAEYEKWKAEYKEEEDFSIDKYMEQLNDNYGKIYNSTDFYFSDNDDEKIFAKDLQEYDGSTLQYIGIMPKNETLTNYTNALTVEKLSSLIGNMKDASNINYFKDGVITKVKGNIPFFNFSYKLKLKDDLEKLGVVNIFDGNSADLSGLTSIERSYIHDTLHKADIDFSNDGIRAAAATVAMGGLGAGGYFDYQWDVPVEEIDMTFDKPFFFLIRDKATGEVWFTGTVYNPAK